MPSTGGRERTQHYFHGGGRTLHLETWRDVIFVHFLIFCFILELFLFFRFLLQIDTTHFSNLLHIDTAQFSNLLHLELAHFSHLLHLEIAHVFGFCCDSELLCFFSRCVLELLIFLHLENVSITFDAS